MKISKILLFINIALLAFIWIFTGITYAGLPEIIPTHFLSNGSVDGESHKKVIWFLPSIATFIFLILISIPRDPQSPMLNVPDSFRKRERLELFSYTLSAPVLLMFADTVIETVLITRGERQEPGSFIGIALGLLFITLGAWIYIMIKEARNPKSNRS